LGKESIILHLLINTTTQVYSRQQKPVKEIGEKFGDYTYYDVPAKTYDIMMRKNKEGKEEVVFDLKTVPFLKDINETLLKTVRISPDHTKVISVNLNTKIGNIFIGFGK